MVWAQCIVVDYIVLPRQRVKRDMHFYKLINKPNIENPSICMQARKRCRLNFVTNSGKDVHLFITSFFDAEMAVGFGQLNLPMSTPGGVLGFGLGVGVRLTPQNPSYPFLGVILAENSTRFSDFEFPARF